MKQNIFFQLLALVSLFFLSDVVLAVTKEYEKSIRTYSIDSSEVEPEDLVIKNCYGRTRNLNNLIKVSEKQFRMRTQAEDYLEKYYVFVDNAGSVFKVTIHFEFNTDYYGKNADFTTVDCLF
jgi:hypothetical protein